MAALYLTVVFFGGAVSSVRGDNSRAKKNLGKAEAIVADYKSRKITADGGTEVTAVFDGDFIADEPKENFEVVAQADEDDEIEDGEEGDGGSGDVEPDAESDDEDEEDNGE